jgi:hypothetical protein
MPPIPRTYLGQFIPGGAPRPEAASYPPPPPPLQLIADTAAECGWERLPTASWRVTYRREVGDLSRRLEIAPSSDGQRPLRAFLVRQNGPEPHTVDFLDEDGTELVDGICAALRAAP